VKVSILQSLINIYILYVGFWRRTLKERDHLEDPGVDGGIILR
jgi:hypothetical protein